MPKYPKKKKRKNYFKVYFQAKPKDMKKVWDFLDSLIDELGNPFSIAKTGRRPKFAHDMRIYTKFCIILGYFDITIDELCGLLPFLAGNTLNRSNIDRWFQRFPEDFAHKANASLHKMLEEMLGYGDYITDATKITTTEYEQTISGGEMVWKLLTVGLHIIVQYFFKEGFLSIVCFEVTDGKAHESPIFREKLLSKANLQKFRRFFGDKGFPSEETFEELFKREIEPQICQRENTIGGMWTRKAKKLYNNNLRKQIRGLVEGVFGGMETETGNKTRFRLEKTRRIHTALRALTHEIRTYFRVLAYKAIQVLLSFATTPVKGSISEAFSLKPT